MSFNKFFFPRKRFFAAALGAKNRGALGAEKKICSLDGKRGGLGLACDRGRPTDVAAKAPARVGGVFSLGQPGGREGAEGAGKTCFFWPDGSFVFFGGFSTLPRQPREKPPRKKAERQLKGPSALVCLSAAFRKRGKREGGYYASEAPCGREEVFCGVPCGFLVFVSLRGV